MEYKAKKDLEVVSFPLQSAVTTVLKKGRKRIEGGWRQHSFSAFHADGSTSFCALGAIDYRNVIAQRTGGQDALHLLALAADVFSFGRTYDAANAGAVSNWNDNPSRTKEEVLQVFDRAIVKSMEADNAV